MNLLVPLQASKWLQIQMLLDIQEMRSLFDEIGDVFIYLVGKVTAIGEETLSKEVFLEKYQHYISQLKKGEELDSLTEYRHWFSSALSLAPDHVFSIPAGSGNQLTRAQKPIVQLQLHMMGYSSLEKKIRPMVLGKGSIYWGIQFSYPQLYLNPLTKKIENVLTEDGYPNTELFHTIQSWMRKNTVPTPFLIDEQRINVPIRLGKQCFSWINHHPQLQALGIKVAKGAGI